MLNALPLAYPQRMFGSNLLHKRIDECCFTYARLACHKNKLTSSIQRVSEHLMEMGQALLPGQQ